MPNPIPVITGSGGQIKLASALLTDGTSAPVHAVSDGNGIVVPALDSSVQALITALGATLKVATPAPTTVVSGQAKIAAAGTAQPLPANALVNGVYVQAAPSNVATVMIGGANVTSANDGTGNGVPLVPGAGVTLPVSNTSSLSIIGTAGDFVSFLGN